MKKWLKNILGQIVYKLLLTLNQDQLSYLFKRFYDSEKSRYDTSLFARYSIHPSAGWGDRTLIYGNGKIEIGEKTIGRFFLLHVSTGIDVNQRPNTRYNQQHQTRKWVNHKLKRYP